MSAANANCGRPQYGNIAAWIVGVGGCLAALVASRPGPKPFAVAALVLSAGFAAYERKLDGAPTAPWVCALAGLACWINLAVTR